MSKSPVAATVLYVEDHPVNVMLMQALFERLPHLRLEVATTGQGAMTRARTLAPILLLLDLGLPDCSGVSLLPRLRELPGLADVPAVAVTADSLFDPTGTSFKEVWLKPLDVPRIVRRLDEITRQNDVRRWPPEDSSSRRTSTRVSGSALLRAGVHPARLA